MGRIREKDQKQKTKLYFLIDSSGSMASIKSAMESGFSEFINEQKKNNVDEMDVTLATFAGNFSIVYKNKPIDEVSEIVIEPAGSTALYDAVEEIIDTINDYKNKATNLILCIITDGEENASKRVNREKVQKIIAGAKESGIIVEYMGTNQDALLNAKNIGVAYNKALNFLPTKDSIDGLWKTMATSVSYTRSTCDSYAYSAEDQNKLVK